MLESVAEMCAAEGGPGGETLAFRGGTFRDRPEERHTLRRDPSDPLSTGFRPTISLARGEEDLVAPWLVPVAPRLGRSSGDSRPPPSRASRKWRNSGTSGLLARKKGLERCIVSPERVLLHG